MNIEEIYPHFDSDILITYQKPYPKVYLEKIFGENLNEENFSIKCQETKEGESLTKGEWILNSSGINLYINDSFINNHFINKTKYIDLFLDRLKPLIHPIAKMMTQIKQIDSFDFTRPFAYLSVFYKTKEDFILQYLFDLEGDDNDYINALIEVFKSIEIYNNEIPNPFQDSIKQTYSQSNNKKYLLYIDKKWYIINPLLDAVSGINKKYREDKDYRIKKPHILMHRDDYSKYFILDTNWVLAFDGLETLLIRPNDVSLYSSVSDKNLQNAKEFYDRVILPRHKIYLGAYPSKDQQKEYYDYFELIITALIFSYTSLEAFANICIPNSFEYLVEKNGVKTIYSKEAIERKFSLREKFKNILTLIIKTPDPSKEKWWSLFLSLEDIRNEIIHTKQSKSEHRYSSLLSKDIFNIIEIHKEIIHFYGVYISENKKDLLQEFPYNFGFDDFYPGLTDEKGYQRSYKTLHNIKD